MTIRARNGRQGVAEETVKTVKMISGRAATPLKRGVNERSSGERRDGSSVLANA